MAISSVVDYAKSLRVSSVGVSPQGTEARVCADIAKRQALGINKYGTTVAQNPLELRAWLQHLYEEQLDAAIYTRRAIEEIDKRALDMAKEDGE